MSEPLAGDVVIAARVWKNGDTIPAGWQIKQVGPIREAGLRDALAEVEREHPGDKAMCGCFRGLVREVRAALLAEPVPGLDVERLARAIDDHENGSPGRRRRFHVFTDEPQ